MSEPINVTVAALTESVQVTGASSNSVTITDGGGVTVKTGSVGVGDTLVTAGTVAVGNVTLLPATSTPTVVNKGTSIAAVLDFGIPAGPATTVAVGSTTTLAPGSSATVTGTASGSKLTLDFGVPSGQSGANGSTPGVSVGTVATLTAGSFATVTATTTKAGDVVLDFGIPRGDTGTNGTNGTSVTLSNTNPLNLGTATPGTSTLASRADHVHNVPTIAQISGLQTALDGKQPVGSYLTNAVKSLNGLTGDLTLAAGSNVSISTSGSQLTIDSTGGVSWANAPACPTSAGTAGQIAYGTDGYFYVCTQNNVWKRVLLTSWACVPPTSSVQFFDQSVVGSVYGDWDALPWVDVTVPSGITQVQAWAIGSGGNGSATASGGGGAVCWGLRSYTGQAVQYRFRTLIFAGTTLNYSEVRVGSEYFLSAGGGMAGEQSGGGGGAGGSNTNTQLVNGAAGTVAGGVFWGGAAGAAGTITTPPGCRAAMPDIQSIRSALALVPKKSIEDCGVAAAAGSGGYYSPAYSGSVVNLTPGYGGGGAYNQTGGPGAILLVFS